MAFPLGGIGTGTISLGGRGQLRDWEIFNRPSKGLHLPYSFVAIRSRSADARPVARVCEGKLAPPYSAGFGLSSGHLAGLPRMAECRFRGEYPFAYVDLSDPVLGVAVHLEAWNPLVPLDEEVSGLPVAILTYTLRNTTTRDLDVSLVASMVNPLGIDDTYQYQAPSNHRWRNRPIFGGNLNEWVDEAGLHGIRMTRPNLSPEDPRFGSLALATVAPNPTFTVRWPGRSWLDDAQRFWDSFLANGRLDDDAASQPTPPNFTDVGSVGAALHLAPGEEATIPILITWYFPNLVNYWNGSRGVLSENLVKGKRLGNYYTTRFTDAWDAARYVAANLASLRGRTRSFHDALFSSTLPGPILDAVSANMSIIRTTTSLRTEDGAFHAFEGSGDTEGSCPMDCTHVWNYEQSLAHLFPKLERSMRETDFLADLFPNGAMAFRSLLPLGIAQWGFKPAADGQMGSVAKVFREWQLSGDTDWLRSLWPAVCRALEFAWVNWDPDQDGVMDGEQHNT
ncbi:MAG: GH116 family glycosyl-hydrolase, partial [Chloroflexota bacterium]